jgi:hypothetical protein
VRAYGSWTVTGVELDLPYMDWWVVRDGRVVDNWGVVSGESPSPEE